MAITNRMEGAGRSRKKWQRPKRKLRITMLLGTKGPMKC